ncbi:MAG: AbrB family transcriptional regulator [Gemmobacter sp.]
MADRPPPSPRLPILWRGALALFLGLVGGGAFFALNLPLPWMLGALTVTLCAAVIGLPIRTPEALRPPVVAVIGVLLGSGFSPDLLGQVPGWLPSLAMLALYAGLSAAVVVPYYRYLGGFDPVTAYFAGMPGGLAEMMMIGRAMGGDDRRIVLAHAARIVVTVAAIAFWFRLVLGYQVSGNPGGPPLLSMALQDVGILVVCGVAGAIVATRLRLPAPTLLGPMVLSGIAHATGLTDSAPPPGLVIAAQVALGTVMGCRFVGVSARDVGRALVLSVGATAMMLGLALGFAVALNAMMGLDLSLVLLAFAPGGLNEMSLVALALQVEVAFVALHHVVRIVLVIALAPLALRLWRR